MKDPRLCGVDGCERNHHAKDKCRVHYYRERFGRTGESNRGRPISDRRCSVDGCDRLHECRGYCDLHYARMRSNGSIEPRPKPTNPYCEVDGCDRKSRSPGSKYCGRCYQRVRNHGDPYFTKTKPRKGSPINSRGLTYPHSWSQG